MSTAFTAVMERLFQQPGLTGRDLLSRLGYKLTASTISATSFATTDPLLARYAENAEVQELQGWHAHLAANSEDRAVTTISVTATGAVTVNFAGGNATVVAVSSTVYLTRVPWPELKAMSNEVLEELLVECLIPLAHGPTDWDMSASSAAGWTGANATIAKQTTASEVFTGTRSLSITATADGGYAQSGLMNVGQAQPVTLHAILKADTGTATVAVLDAGSNVQDSLSTTQEDWIYGRKQVTVDSSDEQLRIRATAALNGDQIDASGLWLVKHDDPLFRLPASVDARFKLKAVSRMRFRQSGTEADTWLAESFKEERIDESHYRFVSRQADANPYWLEFNADDWGDYCADPLFLVVDCPASAPYGVSATFSADSDATVVDLHLLTARLVEQVGAQMPDLFPAAEARGRALTAARTKARETEPPEFAPWTGPGRFRI